MRKQIPDTILEMTPTSFSVSSLFRVEGNYHPGFGSSALIKALQCTFQLAFRKTIEIVITGSVCKQPKKDIRNNTENNRTSELTTEV